jgi:hypothetical protein
MRALWVLTLGLVALAATEGCKRKEPIPGPKAVSMAIGEVRAPGIVWFQGGLDEAFARTARVCSNERHSAIPLPPDMARMRSRTISPSPAACQGESCPPSPTPAAHWSKCPPLV